MQFSNIKRLEAKSLGVAVILHIFLILLYCIIPESNIYENYERRQIKINLGGASENNALDIATLAPYNIEEKVAEDEAKNVDLSSVKTIPNKSMVNITPVAGSENQQLSPDAENNPEATTDENPKIKFQEYFVSLQNVIQQNSGIPQEAVKKKLKGKAVLRLEFDRNGMVKTFNLTHSTGHDILDNAAIAVATKFMTEPLPTPPEELYPEQKLLKFDFGIDYDAAKQ